MLIEREDKEVKEIFKSYEYRAPLDVALMFSTERKIELFLKFFFGIVKDFDDKMTFDEIDFLPVNYENRTTEYVAVDYNFFVFCIASYIKKFDLGDGNFFLSSFAVVDTDNKKDNQNKKNALFLTYIFEDIYKLCYVNSPSVKKMFMSYSTPCIYKNDKKAIQFGALMFRLKELKNYVFDQNIIDSFVSSSRRNNAEQVAYTESTKMKNGSNCRDWWKENKQKHRKRFIFRSDEMSV